MAAERKVHEETEAYLGPVAVAMFVELGWMREWPLTWSKIGQRAVRNGYGRWTSPTVQTLPIYVENLPNGLAHWEGRRHG
jgi:hypothetical protein